MLAVRILLLLVVTTPAVGAPYFVQYYDFGCKTTQEIHYNERFAVDSWYRDNGELTYIQPLKDWKRKREFPLAFNSELAAN